MKKHINSIFSLKKTSLQKYQMIHFTILLDYIIKKISGFLWIQILPLQKELCTNYTSMDSFEGILKINGPFCLQY